YRLLKEEPDPNVTGTISLNHHTLPTVRVGDNICVELSLNPGQTARVRLRQTIRPSRRFAYDGNLYAAKVLLRRALSEFRDEFLVKHPIMLALAKRMAKLLRTSSDSLPRHDA